MKPTDAQVATTLAQQVPHDWARLIRKLRWIGMDKEAKRLEMAARTALHLEQRCGVSSQPFNTLADITM